MKRPAITFAVLLAFVWAERIAYADAPLASAAATAATEAAQERPTIRILATTRTSEPLRRSMTAGEKLAKLAVEQVADVGAQDVTDKLWLALAKRANDVLADPAVDGVIITHGTETLEETAYFLALVLRTEKPVVLVESARADLPASAASFATALIAVTDREARGRGVLVVIGNAIHYARNVTNTSTTSADGFESTQRGAAGLVAAGRVTWFAPLDKRTGLDSEFTVKDRTALPRVDIVYAYANMDATMIRAAIKAGAQGIVVAGVGDGNMPKPARDALTDAATKGIVVVRSTRVPFGIVSRNAAVDDDKLGFVAAGELSPSKARVLTQLALGVTHDRRRIQQLFERY